MGKCHVSAAVHVDCTSSSVFTRNQVTCLYGLHIAVGVRVRSSDSAGDVIGVYDTAC